MCGICGIVNRRTGAEVDWVMLDRINDTMIHRGPDGGGSWVEKNIGFAHRRLSIIDLSDNGRQPMVDPRTGSVLTFNGEIYNYLELKKQFLSDEKFESESDSEVLLKLLSTMGAGAVELLDGMFAFAFYDRPKNQLLLAQDAFGIKPLYYSHQSESILFGSELKPLMHSGLVSQELDKGAVNDFFDFTFIPAPRTIYRSVRKLEPGHVVKLDLESWELESSCYWRPEYTPLLGRSTDDIVEQADAVLNSSVRRHMVADVPVGSFLSGGIDSTLITSSAARQSDSLSAFTVDFDEKKYSEAAHAKSLAATMGLHKHECGSIDANGLDYIEKLAWFYDEPFADSSMIPTYLVCKFARNNSKVCLSGDGGDEMFSGYAHHRVARQLQKWGLLPDRISQGVFRLAKQLFSSNLWMYEWSHRMSQPQLDRSLCLARLPNNRNRLSLIGSALRVSDEDRFWVVRKFSDRLKDLPPVTRCQMFDVYFYLPGDMLTKLDRASMANSLEVRVPFLSKDVTNFAFSIPEEQRFHQGELKYILRRLVSQKFGAQHGSRRKKGFSIPLVQWLKKNNLAEKEKMLLESEPTQNQILCGDGIRQQFADFKRYESNPFRQNRTATNLFSLLTFVAWWDQHHSH